MRRGEGKCFHTGTGIEYNASQSNRQARVRGKRVSSGGPIHCRKIDQCPERDGVCRRIHQFGAIKGHRSSATDSKGIGSVVPDRNTGLQFNGIIVHHNDAVSGPRNETTGISTQVAVVRHDIAISEPMRRGEGQCFCVFIKHNAAVQSNGEACPNRRE